jgi:hypothetical protein
MQGVERLEGSGQAAAASTAATATSKAVAGAAATVLQCLLQHQQLDMQES